MGGRLEQKLVETEYLRLKVGLGPGRCKTLDPKPESLNVQPSQRDSHEPQPRTPRTPKPLTRNPQQADAKLVRDPTLASVPSSGSWTRSCAHTIQPKPQILNPALARF